MRRTAQKRTSQLGAWAVVCAAAIAGIGWPGTASAATASVPIESGGFPAGTSQDELFYQASPGEVNNLTVVEIRSGVFMLVDTGAVITAGPKCTSINPHTVTCVAKHLAGVNLGDRNDRAALYLRAGQLPSPIEAEPRAFVLGGSGNDTIIVKTITRPKGGRSNDFTNSGVFRGTFAVQGGPGNDTIVGSADGDILEGGPGNDRIFGNGGDDVIAGGAGNDKLYGGPGADFVLGGDLTDFELGVAQPRGDDLLNGGAGPDLLAPGPGRSTVIGASGRDALLYARTQSATRRPPEPVSVSFDGRPNDGPPGTHDNVERGVESVISVGSGFFSLAGSFVLRGGVYALAGGSAVQATISLLSRAGTFEDEAGNFAGSSFTVDAGDRRGGVTDITPTGGNFAACGTAATLATTAGKKPHTVRSLFSNVKGHFRTRGRNSSATVRGTEWVMAERCDGTLTSVLRGAVAVRDFHRHRTVIVPAGDSYLAHAPR
jgi:RTX calcium-binding nonapeptide repeat (4 copies)